MSIQVFKGVAIHLSIIIVLVGIFYFTGLFDLFIEVSRSGSNYVYLFVLMFFVVGLLIRPIIRKLEGRT